MTAQQQRDLARALFDSKVTPYWDWGVLLSLGDAGRDAIAAATAEAAAGGPGEDERLLQAVYSRVQGGPAGDLHSQCSRIVRQVRAAG
jgi:hypothetical protein